MMTLLTGFPGNGKTLRALWMIEEEFKRNREANKLPDTHAKWEKLRSFFTNIRGIRLEYVQPIPHDEFGKPDWRLCPDGSMVVFDEAHSDGKTDGLEEYGVLFPSTGKPGESDDPRIRSMSTHRHRGFDLVFITQWPSKIHHQVRTLCQKHVHMNRPMGMERAGVLEWPRVQVDPYDEKQRESAEEEIWAFPKELYSKYRSATLHTVSHKFKFPKKLWGAVSTAVVVVGVAWGGYAYFAPKAPAGEPVESGTGAQAEAPAAPARAAPGKGGESVRTSYLASMKPAIPAMPWTAPAFVEREVVSEPRVFCAEGGQGVDGNGNEKPPSCTCLTEQATEYRLDFDTCVAIARRGEAYNPYRKPVEDRGRGAGAPPAVQVASATAPAPEAATGVGDETNLQQPYGAMRP